MTLLHFSCKNKKNEIYFCLSVNCKLYTFFSRFVALVGVHRVKPLYTFAFTLYTSLYTLKINFAG